MNSLLKAAVVASAALLAVGWIVAPHKVGALLTSLQLAFSVDAAAFAKVLPWIAALLGAYALSKKRIRYVSNIADWVGALMLLGYPILICADLMGYIYTTRISQALEMCTDFEVPLGCWRFMLLFLLMALLFRDEEEWWKVWGWAFSLTMLLCIGLVVVGWFMSSGALQLKPSTADNWLWIAGRCLALSGAFIFASFMRFIACFQTAWTVEPLFALLVPVVFAAVTYLLTRLAMEAPSIEAGLKGTLRRLLPQRSGKKFPFKPRPSYLVREQGHLYAFVNVLNEKRNGCIGVKLMVDTGATHTVILKDRLRAVGVTPKGEAELVLADGRKVKRRWGKAYIMYKGRRVPAPVIFGGKKDMEVLGINEVYRLGIIPEGRRPTSETAETAGTVEADRQGLRPPTETPQAFHYFTSDDGRSAREEANRRGLVALYRGRSKWDLAGRRHEFFAITENLARRILSYGELTKEERQILAYWIQKGNLKVEEEDGVIRVAKLSSGLKKDLKRQVMRVAQAKAKYIA